MPPTLRHFSRWMSPSARSHSHWSGWLLLVLIAGAILYALVTHPVPTLAIFVGIAGLSLFLERQRQRRLEPVLIARTDDDIGSFARAFDRRSEHPLDTWAVRAVWDALLPLTETRGRTIPLRPGDNFESDLGIDPEDVEDLIPSLVERCGRVPGRWEENPYREINTVGDLVHFISAQPLREGGVRAESA